MIIKNPFPRAVFAFIDKADKTQFWSNMVSFLVCYIFGRCIFGQNGYIFGLNGYIFGQNGYIFGQNGYIFGQNGYIFGRKKVYFWQISDIFGQKKCMTLIGII